MNSFSILPPVENPRNCFICPYNYNGGTVVAIAGDGFAVIGADTRMVAGRVIMTRDLKRLFQLNDKAIIGSCGCLSDTLGFIDVVTQRVQMYEAEHSKTISVASVAQLMSLVMYNRRFFPYYNANILAGLDSEGKGHVYSYDPLGHFEDLKYAACGSGGQMIDPVLDNQIGYKNRDIDPKDIPKMTKERAIALIGDAFTTVCERDVFTGDSAIIKIITKDGIEEIQKELPND